MIFLLFVYYRASCIYLMYIFFGAYFSLICYFDEIITLGLVLNLILCVKFPLRPVFFITSTIFNITIIYLANRSYLKVMNKTQFMDVFYKKNVITRTFYLYIML